MGEISCYDRWMRVGHSPAGLLRRSIAAVTLCICISYSADATSSQGVNAAYLVPKVPHRLALVIGNDEYSAEPLPAAPKDMANVTNALVAAGFDVTSAENVKTQSALVEEVLKPFLNRARAGDVIVVYYFGHGFAHNADNFLVPTQASTAVSEADIYDNFLPERAIRDLIKERQPGLAFLFLDACRLVIQFRDAGAPPPLVAQATPEQNDEGDIVVSYAADYGDAAFAPASNAVSYYTEALARELPSPGTEFGSVQRAITYDVAHDSDNKQKAWFYSNIESLFYFKPTAAVQDKERQLWEATLQEGTRDAVDRFLHTNRASVYAADAKQWLRDHPSGQPGQRVTFSRVSPLSPELLWNSEGVPVALPRLSSTLGVARTLRLPSDQSTYAFANASNAELLAASTTAFVTVRSATATADAGRASVRLPFGQEVDIEPGGANAIKASAMLYGSVRQIRLPVAKKAPGVIHVGRPLAEIALDADASLPEIIDLPRFDALVVPVLANAKFVGWVSVSSPGTADPKQERLLDLQTTFVRYQLIKHGVPETRISVVRNDTSNSGPLRIRIFGLAGK
jgi:uncharacterized caspase-like protein